MPNDETRVCLFYSEHQQQKKTRDFLSNEK